MIQSVPYPNLTRLLTNVVAPFDPRLTGTASGVAANQGTGVRVTIPYAGVLHDLSIYIGATSGNIDVGIYDTTATTRNRLWSSGSIAAGSANTWQTAGDPALAVAAGDQLDFAAAADNTTVTFGRFGTVNLAVNTLPASFWPSPLGGSNRLAWTRATSFPLPATIAESGLASGSAVAIIIARLTPA